MDLLEDAQPNKGHEAVNEIMKKGGADFMHVTQNIDNLNSQLIDQKQAS